MKTIFSFLISFLFTSLAFSQTQTGTVTINTTGNKVRQLIVDTRYYTIDNTTTSQVQPISISDLENGSHTLTIIRKGQFNRNVSTKSTFTLRSGYDLTINIDLDGTIVLSETRSERWGNNTGRPISTGAFNKLYTQTKNKTSSASRSAFLENEFTNTAKLFTAKQASQLIQLVNSESMRLKLSKQSYTRITDTQNFSLVVNLLNSSSNRVELNNYIATLPDNDGDDNGNATNPITDEKFRIIYNELSAEPSVNDKVYYLTNFFGRDFNYYTSSQASQLIQLVNSEQERFNLAKAAYRGVTDRSNYNVVYQLLGNSYNRSELLAYMRAYDNNNNTTTMTAMSTSAFNSLYNNIYYQNSSSSRYTAINKAFTTTGNYFTVAQAKKLIPLVNDENSRLVLSKAAYLVLVDRSNYAEFNEFLVSNASRNDFYNYVKKYDNSGGTGIGVAMTDADYNKLYTSVNGAWNTTTRFNLINDAVGIGTNYFTVYQVRQLLLLITSESDRLSLAKRSYDNIVDPANFSQLYDLFNNTNNRNDLASFVASAQNGGMTTVRIPMSETEYNSVYKDVQLTFGLGAKMSSLTNIFNQETNYFTVQQAKALIQLVSAETNKLELAKSSYNNITDPENFSSMYDIFSSQSAKNELMTFVTSSAYINR